MNILSVVKELVSIAISHIARSVSNHIPKIVINMHEYQYDDIQQLYNLSVSVSTSNLKLQGSEIKQSVLGSSFLKQFSEHYNPQDRYTISVIFANSSSGNIANYVFSRDNSSIGYKIVKTISGNMNNHIQGCKFEVEFQNISNYENFESIQNFLLVSTLCNPRLSLHFQVNGKEILNSEGHNFGYSNQPFLTVMSKRCQYAIHPTEPNSELTITSASDPFILTRKMQASSKYVLKENSIEQGLCSQSFIFSSHSENWPIGRSRIYCVLGLNSENVELFEEHCIRMDEERNSKDKLVDLEMEKENGSTTEEESESTSISDKEDPIENGKEIQKKETENAMIQILPFINGFPLFQIASRNYKQFTNSVKSPIKSPSNSYYSSSPQYNKSSSQTESQQAALNLLNLIPATDLIQILLDPFIGSSYKQEDDNDCNEDSIEQWNFGIEPENNDNEQEQDGNNETLVDELNDKGEYPFGKDCGVDPSSMRWQFIESVCKTQINDNQFKENKIVGYETEIFGGVLYMLTTIAQQKLMNRQMKQESKYKFIETRENQKLARLSQMYFKKEAREEKKRELNERKDTTKKLKKKIENQISTTKKQNLGKKKKQRTNLNKLKQCDNSIEPYAEFNSSNVESYTNYLSQEPVKTNAKSQEVNKGESINDVCPNSDYQSKVKRKRENEDEEETQIERKRWRESQSQIESDSCDEADDDPFGLFRDYALLE
ncbi:MAG: hypothetical protein EZS28_009135 [Streblomastix strix]|uniref:Uncharacterized protein n=1 Tax=Streblomastix strix TaxID=222440 RepID=A0A5J4WJV4_9EUKA|nr:MAG: hypothetical protein EZS28_009135 [Streblomastix strix]